MAFRSWTYFCFLERGYRGYYQHQQALEVVTKTYRNDVQIAGI